jgi:hypothetical protein
MASRIIDQALLDRIKELTARMQVQKAVLHPEPAKQGCVARRHFESMRPAVLHDFGRMAIAISLPAGFRLETKAGRGEFMLRPCLPCLVRVPRS